MKKAISLLSVFALIFSMFATSALAVEPRATQPPTTYAKSSFYGTENIWTCSEFTYTSNLFQPTGTAQYIQMIAECDKAFSIEAYDESGNLLGSVAARYVTGKYHAVYNLDFYQEPFDGCYFILRNANKNSPINETHNPIYIVNMLNWVD